MSYDDLGSGNAGIPAALREISTSSSSWILGGPDSPSHRNLHAVPKRGENADKQVGRQMLQVIVQNRRDSRSRGTGLRSYLSMGDPFAPNDFFETL